MPQRRCINCKRFISNDATFCKSCGAVQPLPEETTSDRASGLSNHGITNETNPSVDSSSTGCGCLVLVAFLLVLFLLTTTCSGPRHRSSSYNDDGSSSLGGTTTTLDDGTVMTYDDDGTIYYKNPDGSLEVTDGWGNVVKDTDGDGMADSYSIDGGESWGYL